MPWGRRSGRAPAPPSATRTSCRAPSATSGSSTRARPGAPRPAGRSYAGGRPRRDPRAVHAQATRVSGAVDDHSASRRLARFALGLRLDDVPPPVVARAGLLVLDTLGCALAAAPTDFGNSVIATPRALGGASESTIIGGGTRVGAPSAVLAN